MDGAGAMWKVGEVVLLLRVNCLGVRCCLQAGAALFGSESAGPFFRLGVQIFPGR